MGRRKQYTPEQMREKRREYSKKSYIKYKSIIDEKAKARYKSKHSGLST